MNPHKKLRRAVMVTALTGALVAMMTSTAGATFPGHSVVVNTLPKTQTPNVLDGEVDAIYDDGTHVLLGGTFTQAQNHGDTSTTYARNYILSFNKSTGLIDTTFNPALSGPVTAIIAGPTAGTAYIAGQFNTVNGTNRRKVAEINVSTGAVVTAFGNAVLSATATALAVANGHLLVGGNFVTAAGGVTRNGLVSLNPTTGAVDSYLTTALTGHHNYNGTNAQAAVGVEAMVVTPDASQLWVIGNFKMADGVVHDQIAKINLGPTSASLDTNWNTSDFSDACSDWAFDSWVRDIAVSPDGSYFSVVATGGPHGNTNLCDTITRWETNSTGTSVHPTWINWTGGDTTLSVAASEQAIYVGGHFRWLNNSFGGDSPGAGAIGRASIAALDPRSGMPMSWNPGRNPRGNGVDKILLTTDGLWMGYDTDYLGNFQYKHQRVGFYSINNGVAPASTATATLPGNVYFAGPRNTNVVYRVNTGGPAIAAVDGGPDWVADQSDPSPYRNSGSNTAGWGQVGSLDASVPAATPIGIFSTERWDPGDANEMQWAFPVPAGEHIAVRLYFANQYSGTANVGQRVFNVTLDGAPVLSNYDIVADVGNEVGEMKEWDITSDGTVDIGFGHVVENPLINGIEILNLDAAGGPDPNSIQKRTYDGSTSVGALTGVSDPSGTQWSNARGAFWVGGTLFYGWSDGKLYERTFNGTTFGAATLVNPYSDAYWDTVQTGSGQTYAGVQPNFYGSELQSVTGMFYSGGKLYYTVGGHDQLYYRWFTPDNGSVGADEFTVSGSSGFADSGGIFTSGGNLYMVGRGTGNLTEQSFAGGVPGGSPTTVSGPAIDGTDWRADGVFVGP